MISNEFITEVLEHTDIVNFIGGYLKLEKSGENYKGLCPWHKEKTPSFSVSPTKKIFKCFGCGQGGDAIKFLMKIERKNFPEAVYSLALRIGLIESEIEDEVRGTIYALELTGGKYYIGFTQHLQQRLEAHFSGKGSTWTKTHPPVQLLESLDDAPFEMENEWTQRYMSLHGWRNVRGGDYVFPRLDYKETPEALHRKKKDGAYLLLLDQGKYFVGFHQDMDADISRQFQGLGHSWTKRYRPQRVLKRVKTLNVETSKFLTLQAMRDYGWEHVRGYRWTADEIQRPKELDLP